MQGGTSATSGGSTGAGGTSGSTATQGGQTTSGGSTVVAGQGGASSLGGSTAGGPAGGASPSGGSATGGGSFGGSATGGVPTGGGSSGGSSGGTSGGAASGGSGGLKGNQVGPTFDQFFDNKKLATIRITLPGAIPTYSPAAHCPPFNYTKAQVVYESPDGVGNTTMENVGWRFRGSRAQPKQGFKLDVQVLDTAGASGKRRFADLNRINILSLEGDDTHMAQCLSYKILRDAGVPAPRCNHLKVYINNQLYGVMENVEQVNKGYVRRRFGTNAGSLYGASPSMGDCASGGFQDSLAQLVYSGDSFSSYTTQYQLTHASATEAQQNLIPMLKCGDSTATPDDNTFKTCIQEWIDVNEWLKEIALESVMPALESWIGYYRNYYLYFKQDTAAPHGGRFNAWSWDFDTSFNLQRCNTSTCDLLTGVSSFYGGRPRAKLVTRLTTVFRQEYCTALNAALGVYKTSQVDDMANVMSAAMASEPNTTQAAWQTAVSAFKSHITSRTTAVQSQISSICK